MTGEVEGLRQHAREQAAAANQRKTDWARRQVQAQREPEPLVCPPGANERQRAAWHSATSELMARERRSAIHRGWVRIARKSAPPGTIPLCVLHGGGTVVLCIDLRGQLRQVEGGKAGAVVTVSEAAAIARGLIAAGR